MYWNLHFLTFWQSTHTPNCKQDLQKVTKSIHISNNDSKPSFQDHNKNWTFFNNKNHMSSGFFTLTIWLLFYYNRKNCSKNFKICLNKSRKARKGRVQLMLEDKKWHIHKPIYKIDVIGFNMNTASTLAITFFSKTFPSRFALSSNNSNTQAS